MTGCGVCPTYSDEVNLLIDRAGLNHHIAMAALRRMEGPNSPGRAVVMGPTLGIAGHLVHEADLTAAALGFPTA